MENRTEIIIMALNKSTVSPQFHHFVQLCSSPSAKKSTKIKVEGRTTMIIKIIPRIFKLNSLHPGREQSKEEYKPGSSTDKGEMAACPVYQHKNYRRSSKIISMNV